MKKIILFEVSEDKKSLNLHLEGVAEVVQLWLWTERGYKRESDRIDLSDLLTGDDTQQIVISSNDVGRVSLDGIYFIQVGDNLDLTEAIAADLTKYRECLLKKVLQKADCTDCPKELDEEILNIHVMLSSLELAIKKNLPRETLNIAYSLDKFCKGECEGCK